MKKISCCFLFLLVVSIYSKEKESLPVVSEVKELKNIQAKKIIWQKDKSIMVAIPSSDTIKPFWIDTTEITVGQFKKFLAESDHPFSGDLWKDIYQYSPTDSHPMIYVDWHDATAYAKWVGKRLTTEEEWDWAARGGLVNKNYSWGNDESLARDYANYFGTGGKDKWYYTTSPVGRFKSNGYGLYDMTGNAFEWCQDWYDSDKDYKVLRGGSWLFFIDAMFVALRVRNRPSDRINHNGFRCVLGLP
ncbi:hypothetical protein CMK18_15715 [Candidatus Poribacteria bacterium]|nr:hypothetical protein [Candidatus Poribacteria bacterium]